MDDMSKLNQGWIVFMFALFLGFFSYVISLFVFRKKESISIQEYLFSGNSYILSVASIVGSIFSVAIFFTAITALYRLYGLIILPTTIIPAAIGLFLLKRKIMILFQKENEIHSPEIIESRFQKLVHLSKHTTAFPFYFIFYLFMMAVTEIAAFHNAIVYYFPNDLWTELITYFALIIITAYIFISGFKGALITDLLQMIFIIVIVIAIVFSLKDSANIIEVNELIKFPPISQIILYSIGSIIICITWFSSSPEIIQRVLSLKNIKNAHGVLTLSMFLFPLIILVPLLIMTLSGIYPVLNGDSEEAYKVWFYFFERSSNIIPILFFMLITAAFFTTVNTYMISLSQIIHSIKGKNILEKFFPKNVRYASILIFALALFISTKLNIKLNSILGVYAGSLMIPNFMMIYIYPKITYLKSFIQISSVWIQLVAAPLLIYIFISISNNAEVSHLVYPLIPLSLAVIEVFVLLSNIIISFWRHNAKK